MSSSIKSRRRPRERSHPDRPAYRRRGDAHIRALGRRPRPRPDIRSRSAPRAPRPRPRSAIIISAPGGAAHATYVVIITRAASDPSDAALSSLSLNGHTLTPAFDPEILRLCPDRAGDPTASRSRLSAAASAPVSASHRPTPIRSRPATRSCSQRSNPANRRH